MQQKKSKCHLRLVSKKGSFVDTLYPPHQIFSTSDSMGPDAKVRLEDGIQGVRESMTRLQNLMTELRSLYPKENNHR